MRIEVGPRDLEKNQAVVTRRDIGVKEFVPLDQIPAKVVSMLAAMQKELLETARAFRDANTFKVDNYDQFKKELTEKGGFFVAPWCQSKECEAKVKTETKATIRCLPLENYKKIKESGACMACGTADNSVRAIFAISY